jgi:thiol-disulfide isomerase/thioredoxin
MNTNIKDTGETRTKRSVTTKCITQIKANYTNKLFVPFVPIRAIRVLLIVFFVPAWFLTFACDSKPPQTVQSTKAPDFALLDMAGKEVKLSDLISDKPLVLDFWASWCSSCRAEIPKVVELYNQYQDKITIIGINLDKSLADAQKYTQKNFIPYPNLFDEDGKVANLYGVLGIPHLIIINAKGEIVKRNATVEDVKALAK